MNLNERFKNFPIKFYKNLKTGNVEYESGFTKGEAKTLNDAPINTDVKLNEEDAKNLAYGDVVKNAKTIDYKVVNPLMNDWINKWNRVMN